MIRVDHRFASMGGTARITLESAEHERSALERHAAAIRGVIEDVEAGLSRFRPDSELSALNRDPRPAVPATPLLRHFAMAVHAAGARSGGLVDATLLASLEDQGYTTSRAGVAPAGLDEALAAAPPRRPARPHPARAHAGVGVDAEGRVVRPRGVRLDSGGLGKGLAADLAAITVPDRHPLRDLLRRRPRRRRRHRPIAVGDRGAQRADRRGGAVAARPHGGVATSGHHVAAVAAAGRHASPTTSSTPRRASRRGPASSPVTAVAATTLDAEVLAKTAMLSGPDRARTLLGRRGGVLQHEDGRVEIVAGHADGPAAAPGAGDVRVNALDHGWWLASRSAGVVAYLLLSASVVLGLAMALRLAPPRSTAVLRTAHERIALIALGAVAAHGLLLLGDSFLRPGLSGILVPFAMDYRPVWTGIGILAGYLAAGLVAELLRPAAPRRPPLAHRAPPDPGRVGDGGGARHRRGQRCREPVAAGAARADDGARAHARRPPRARLRPRPRGPTARTRARRAADPADAGAGAPARLRGPDPADGGRPGHGRRRRTADDARLHAASGRATPAGPPRDS